MKRVLIKVTQDDIDHGQKSSCGNCPIARAVNRTMGELACAWVGVDDLTITDPTLVDRKIFKLPKAASIFIKLFDNDRPVIPFNFYMTEVKS